MNCIICDGVMAFSFSKTFTVHDLCAVDYWACPNCGFVLSKTHAEMTPGEREVLTRAYHQSYQGTGSNPDDPRWLERLHSQARVLDDATRLGLLNDSAPWLDYGCGDSKLSALLGQDCPPLLKYDRHMPLSGYLCDSDLTPGYYGFVITTSVFEHLTRRKELDAIHALVSPDGVLGIHTLVCEQVPRDPSWFYLLPVHCAFFTNHSMALLMAQWGYVASIYNAEARLWLWFKVAGGVRGCINGANRRCGGPVYIYRDGFVPYPGKGPRAR